MIALRLLLALSLFALVSCGSSNTTADAHHITAPAPGAVAPGAEEWIARVQRQPKCSWAPAATGSRINHAVETGGRKAGRIVHESKLTQRVVRKSGQGLP